MTHRFSPFLEAMDHITKAQHLLQKGPASYYTEQFVGAYEYLMNTFSPFEPGDCVILLKVPDPYPSGWEHCKHFIKVGAPAKIANVECDKHGFYVNVTFDDESWIDSAKNLILMEPDRKHTFYFRASDFVKVS